MKVAFIGNRELVVTQRMKDKLKEMIEDLIVKEHADTFFFGSKSAFDELCFDTVTELKRKHIRLWRVYVRTEYPTSPPWFMDKVLMKYEDTIYPERVLGAGRKSYIERNKAMIDMCDVLLYYRDPSFVPRNAMRQTNSGTAIAVDYATKLGRSTIDFFSILNG